MTAEELISEIVPAIRKDDKASEALNWMDVFRVSHLPIVEETDYLGLISDADIFDTNAPDSTVMSHHLSLNRPFVKQHQHIYEIADVVTKYKLSTVPVLTETEEYLGVITITDLAHEFSSLMASGNPGGIVVLEVKTNDYALSEIAQIIESNDAKILSLYVRSKTDEDAVIVTIKVNRTDITAIIQTFERYSYKIKAIFSDSEELDSLLKDRLDSFLKYLNI